MGNGKIPSFSVCKTKFVLETDQKPLETILAKSLNAATPRLQRILIKTFAYDFTVKYQPGEHNQLADCLSRLGCLQDKIKLPRLKVHLLTTRLSATSDKLHRQRLETLLRADQSVTQNHQTNLTWKSDAE